MYTKEGLFKQICDAVVEMDDDKVIELAQASLDQNLDPLETILNGLSKGMLTVGDLYEKKEYFVPEILLCAEAMQGGLDLLQPYIVKVDSKGKGVIVIGTVQGDVHDIGKNIVKLMLGVGGFEIVDLGRDVPLNMFAEEAKRQNADVVAMSAMMTTTMLGMKTAIPEIREAVPQAGIMIGGAPVTGQIVKDFGADGYAENAGTVIEATVSMLKRLNG
jgi:corrinoid protein of di/trimethylamine methyltransferase